MTFRIILFAKLYIVHQFFWRHKKFEESMQLVLSEDFKSGFRKYYFGDFIQSEFNESEESQFSMWIVNRFRDELTS